MEALGVNQSLGLVNIEHLCSGDASVLAPAGDSGRDADLSGDIELR